MKSSSCIFVFAFMISIKHAVSESASEDSYANHCSSVIPPYNITARSDGDSLPSLSTSYFTGGGRFQSTQPGAGYGLQKNLRLRLRPDHYQTAAAGVYKVEGYLYITFSYGSRDDTKLNFPMNGFWSEKTRKLCMVGSTSWNATDLEAVLKLKFDGENPTIHTSVVSGSLESTASANDPAYFNPFFIFDFPTVVPDYNYSLVSEKIGAVIPSRKGESVKLDSTDFCTVMERGLRSIELGYAAECAGRRRPHRCSPVGVGDEFLPDYISLTSIQCVKGAKKARFLATFQNYSNFVYDNFPHSSTAIGEAWWDDKSSRIIGAACPILNPSLNFGNVVGDCTTRLNLRLPSTLTLRNDAKIVGEIWSSEAAAEDSGYFRPINLTINEDYGELTSVREPRYEYTDLERVRKSCTQKKKKKKMGNDEYPDARSSEMRFDLNVRTGNNAGNSASGSATPLWVENNSFKSVSDMLFLSGAESAAIPQLQKLESADITGPTRMRYKITMYSSYRVFNSSTNVSTPIQSLDWAATTPSGAVAIAAEGFYDARNGQLCMVGCRKLAGFKDCEIIVEFELPMLNGERGRLVKGVIRSTRPRMDPLHFDDLVIESAAYNLGEAKRSIWRMDFEIGMVFISNALVCIFVALQIFHVRRNPELPSSVSLVMLVILCAGHVIPLVLNFEAVLLGYRDRRMAELGNGGMLEANEVAVRVMMLVTLLLQIRLLQLVYARKEPWNGERKAGFVCVSFYIFGCLLSLDVRKTHGVWGDLRSYGGVILDGFLLPQIVSNIFRGSDSGEKALCRWFYGGTSAVRLVPHAYNQYRSCNYPKYDLEETYYYANPATELYSTAWDFIIPCGILALAVIVFLQQRHGGRCILPQRFRGFGKMPTLDNR